MTQTRTETLALTDGTELRLTAAEPDNVVRGGLVVLHEARGVTERVRELAELLAEEGWLTVVPHLYHRDGPELADGSGELASDGEEGVRHQVSRLSGESVLADTDTAFVWLAERSVPADRLGVLGFDVGGSVALMVAASRSVGAAVTVGGGGIVEPLSPGLPSLLEIAGELTCPWLGLYGEDERHIPSEEIEKLRDVAGDAEVATDVVRYPGVNHRFDDGHEKHVAAWQRALNWLDTHLR